MFNKVLLRFSFNCDVKNNADLGEKIGNIGLGLLRIGFGKTVTVKTISSDAGRIIFTEREYSTSAKVAAVALFILALPVTMILAGIGYIARGFSKSYEQIFNSYHEHQTVRGKAVITIQKYFRGYLARKPHLPSNLYSQYSAQIKKIQEDESQIAPKAEGGKTTVLLPTEMPEIVLKYSGREAAIKRFGQMRYVRSILDSQNSSHLIIPKANLCENCLVEQRLPINVDSYHNMELYLSQPTLFDEAVRELTRLFSRIHLSDLLGGQYNPLGYIAGAEGLVRYDNLPLYIVEENGKKEGKIGLIDLENMEQSPNSQGLATLARIFPLHLDMIKNEATKLNMTVDAGLLDSAAQKGKQYLKMGFTDHLEWLRKKGVSTSSPQPFQVSVQRTEQLTNLLEKELLKLNQGNNDMGSRIPILFRFHPPAKDFFTENPEKTAKTLAEAIVPLVIQKIKAKIEESEGNQLRTAQIQDMTESQLVSLRSPIMKRRDFCEDIELMIVQEKSIITENHELFFQRDIAEQLIYVFMEELVRGGEIFYFDPAYYTGDHGNCWIRY